MKHENSYYGDCDVSPNGEIALKMFEHAHEESAPYELITMDIHMPDLSGQEVVSKIREWEDKHQSFQNGTEAKILMVTVKEDAQNIISSFREGCEWYLTKPVMSEAVEEALEKLQLL